MAGTVRRRSNGTFELRITHRLLGKPYYSTHDSDADAKSYAEKLVAKLDRGELPAELAVVNEKTAPKTKLSAVLAEYRRENRGISSSDKPMVEFLERTLGISLQEVTVRWTDDWIREMQASRLAPGTIRKRVDSLGRAVDWYNRKHQRDVSNPLRTLPKGYSSYGDVEDAPRDEKRDRRLHPGEYEKIEAVILGRKREDRQRPLALPERDDYLLLFRLLVHSGMRLREAYTLRVVDLKVDLKTIHVRPGKTGRARDIPMTKDVQGWVLQTLSGRAHDVQATVFQLWDGDPKTLKPTTVRISAQLKRIFEYTGCDDLTSHDLRHEAVCRWMLMKDGEGRWLYRPEEVRRITGHQNVQQFERYLSLRGSDLAERL